MDEETRMEDDGVAVVIGTGLEPADAAADLGSETPLQLRLDYQDNELQRFSMTYNGGEEQLVYGERADDGYRTASLVDGSSIPVDIMQNHVAGSEEAQYLLVEREWRPEEEYDCEDVDPYQLADRLVGDINGLLEDTITSATDRSTETAFLSAEDEAIEEALEL